MTDQVQRLLLLAAQRGGKVQIDFEFRRDVEVTFTQGARDIPGGDLPEAVTIVGPDLAKAARDCRTAAIKEGL